MCEGCANRFLFAPDPGDASAWLEPQPQQYVPDPFLNPDFVATPGSVDPSQAPASSDATPGTPRSGVPDGDPSGVTDEARADGSGGVGTTVAASGNQLIDGLLTGLKWSLTNLTYSNPDAASDYQAGYFVDRNNNTISAQNEGFAQISAAQLQAVHFALSSSIQTQAAGALGFSVSAFTGLNITYAGAGTGNATLRYANTTDNATGLGYYPSSSIYGGDGWLGSSIQNPITGNYGYNNTIHEIGHTLGLKHGQDSSGGGTLPNFGPLPTNYDSLEFTVMTYRSYVGDPLVGGYSNEQFGYPQSFMMLDIAALQYMYGADFTTNAGNTTYTWNPSTGVTSVDGVAALTPGGNRIFATIWDGGGFDTYDLSNYTTGVQINLKPGEWSLFSTTQRANLGDGNFARGNIANALEYSGDVRSLIENAYGGSGIDTIIGNRADNILLGNGASDALFGEGGRDVAVFLGNSTSSTRVHNANGTWTVTGVDGTDTLTNVEVAQFANRRVVLEDPLTDFNADSVSELLWFQQSTGAALIRNPGNPGQSGGSANLAPVGANWTIQTTGDFNGDGYSDFAWKNTSTGQFYLWNFVDSSQTGGANLGAIGTNWSIMGSGDFNVDGTGDIVWRDANNGHVYLYMMQNNAVAAAASLGVIGAEWTVAAVGDFNGDGSSDLTLRRSTDGLVYVWSIANGAIIDGDNYGALGTNWSVAGAGDFNRDGTDDILLRNAIDGTLYIWNMTNSSISGGASLGAIGAAWTVDAIADMNGDFTSDILLKNTSTGQFYQWNIANNAVASSADLGVVGTDWQLI